jgi:hypothetical protein
MNFRVFITFDIDLGTKEEMEFIHKLLSPFLRENNIRATWFIRLDKKIETDFGEPDFLFKEYENLITKLLDEGHAIGWHPHIYTFINGRYEQSTYEDEILQELEYLLPYVRKYNINIVRMGWGFQTNRIMKFLDDSNFVIDSSAIPRQVYTWDQTKKDWSITGLYPYHPSILDYRIPSNDPLYALKILEVPITTMKIETPYDTEKDVIRYCNLSYYSNFLEKPLEHWIRENDFLVTITHPYELSRNFNQGHQLISFSLSEFSKNISLLTKIAKIYNKNVSFETLSEILDYEKS